MFIRHFPIVVYDIWAFSEQSKCLSTSLSCHYINSLPRMLSIRQSRHPRSEEGLEKCLSNGMNGCRQNESHSTPVHQSTSGGDESCVFVGGYLLSHPQISVMSSMPVFGSGPVFCASVPVCGVWIKSIWLISIDAYTGPTKGGGGGTNTTPTNHPASTTTEQQ